MGQVGPLDAEHAQPTRGAWRAELSDSGAAHRPLLGLARFRRCGAQPGARSAWPNSSACATQKASAISPSPCVELRAQALASSAPVFGATNSMAAFDSVNSAPSVPSAGCAPRHAGALSSSSWWRRPPQRDRARRST